MELLIDADIVTYRFASAMEETIDWGGGNVAMVTDLPRAKQEFASFIKYLEHKTGASSLTLCFSHSLNFRYGVLPTYKHNRASTAKPRIFVDLKLWAMDEYPNKAKPGLEADDVMGVLSTLNPGRCCIATIDKDLLQIPGLHYDWSKKLLFTVDEDDAEEFFYTQILAGDPTDGYSGIPGIGPARAAKILKCYDRDGWWRGIVHEYKAHGLTARDALQMARVARICRAEDYNFQKGEVILWSPKS